MYNILICDDERDIVNALAIYLSNPSCRLLTAYDGAEALEILRREEIHLVLLDIMMPKLDGISVLKRLRETGNMPVILLTAKSEDTDIISGLNAGADDYIVKPFNPPEVAARVNSQLRRYTRLGGAKTDEVYISGGIELNDREKTVSVDGNAVSLTPKEYEILKLLIAHPGKVFSPAEIYRSVWKEAPLPGSDNNVAVHIRHLREKIEFDANDPRYIKVMFGRGYRFEKGRNE